MHASIHKCTISIKPHDVVKFNTRVYMMYNTLLDV